MARSEGVNAQTLRKWFHQESEMRKYVKGRPDRLSHIKYKYGCFYLSEEGQARRRAAAAAAMEVTTPRGAVVTPLSPPPRPTKNTPLEQIF